MVNFVNTVNYKMFLFAILLNTKLYFPEGFQLDSLFIFTYISTRIIRAKIICFIHIPNA